MMELFAKTVAAYLLIGFITHGLFYVFKPGYEEMEVDTEVVCGWPLIYIYVIAYCIELGIKKATAGLEWLIDKVRIKK